ncbi:MAG: sulfatase-like hydrolase/transferase [Armatimonadetes bacterium]|nr:sulfatase-like hydrolase/transferase [Armatimonadota bacterium]
MARISRRGLLKAAVGGAITIRTALMSGEAKRRQKPNILVIITDDMGYCDVGFHGCEDIPTPNIDSLAKNGIRFTNGYVSHPWCAPTRAGLMTGRYQQRFGFENNPRFSFDDEIAGIPENEITLAQLLKEAGYACGIIGKWHLGAHPKFHPIKRGFEEFFGFRGGGHNYFKSRETLDAPMYQLPLERNFDEWIPLKGYLTFVLAEEAVQFIKRHSDKPFFFYLAFNAPHAPLQAPEEYVSKFEHINDKRRRLYAAMMNALDDAVGQVLQNIRDLGLEDDTIIFFLSDNGGPIGDASNGSRNEPLRGGKGGLYEGGIRVPFVIQWISRLPSGKVYEHPVICLDIFSTSLAAANVPFPKDRKIDGVNLLPYLRGERTDMPHEFLFWRIGGGNWMAVRDSRYKLHRRKDGTFELYDLQVDIGEKHNLANGLPEIVNRLNEALNKWNNELIPPIFPPPKKDEAT